MKDTGYEVEHFSKPSSEIDIVKDKPELDLSTVTEELTREFVGLLVFYGFLAQLCCVGMCEEFNIDRLLLFLISEGVSG